MASTTITSSPQPLATTSNSRQNHLNRPPSFSSTSRAYEDQETQAARSNMSFGMSQGSQGNGLMMQPGQPFRQYEGNSQQPRRNSAPQIYSAIYSGVDVYEMEVNDIAVMRRRKDSWLNATQILKVAGIEKGKRTKVLEKEILIGEHEKVQGGYGKYQGTWIKFERGLEFCRQYGVEDLLRPLLTYDMGQDGGVAGRGGIDTPTKEQAMAAQRKRLYNSGAENRSGGQTGTFFKNISSTASHAVAAISKARFDSPAPRMRNGASSARPPSFSRQASQQNLASQENAYPGGSQQSMQSFASNNSFTANGLPDSAYSTQYNDARNGDFEEPPRKRTRPSPVIVEQQQMDGYYDLSMREPSPTEANESFAYHSQMTQGDEHSTLPPLPNPSCRDVEQKKNLLLTLFTDAARTDFSNHLVFLTLTPQDLDTPIDKSSNTALIWAATLARIPLLQALIAAGASIYRVNRVGETALMRSCVVTNNLDLGSFPDLLEVLGPTIEFTDSRYRTVLHHIAVTSAVKGRSSASKYYLESLLEFVVRAGTAPNSQQSQSFSSNQVAAHTMNLGRFMSEVVNIQDKSGDTALNIAARIGNRSIISQLLEVGANPEIKNRSGLCPHDFGVGESSGNNEANSGRIPPPERVASRTNQTSNEIIASISSMVTDVEREFTKELDDKQTRIDSLHAQLRESSALLGEQRRRRDLIETQAKEQAARKHKLANLTRAMEGERARLRQMRQQTGQASTETDMNLGDADKGLSPPALPQNVLASLNSQPNQTVGNLDQAQRQLLSSLPPAHVLRARISAYQSNNQDLEQDVQDLQSKSSELANKYRRVVGLCTNTPVDKVDQVAPKLLRAIESEPNVDLRRIREFLSRVEVPS
ncbi:hypothetical protein BJ875DRAFT_121236 [Amylocarpus encephaloides]|uniref:Transcription factor SWI6 n=1 Tax=Amylocarpus encephaloides TaxID=45428 RepID=A0A9P7YQF4_9HELO|nr:hypothetical protein BJ875DRAFT_121236 [Amylocarpus encephaloides]